MFDWIELTLGEVVTLQRGHDLPTQNREEGEIPVMGSFGVTGYHNDSRAKGPGVTIGRSGGSMGVVSYIGHDYWPLNTVLFVTDFHGNDERFVYYLLKTINFESYNTGSAQASLNRNYIYPVNISIPKNIEEQRRVAKVLSDFERKIELNRQINQTLEQIAQAIFKSWFVDFEPVKAKIQAKQNSQDPERAAMRAISGKTDEELDEISPEHHQQLAETAAVFPDELEDSELGEIPKGWNYGTLDELCWLNKNSWTKKNTPEKVQYVDLANTNTGVIEDIQCYAWEEAPSRARRILNPGDSIVGTVRPGNRSFAFIGARDEQLTGSTGFAVLTPKKDEYQEYIYIAATSDKNIERLAHLADGAAYPAVRPDIVTNMEIAIADEEVFKKFSDIAHRIFSQREVHFTQNKILKGCRDTLLPKLLSGDISFGDTKSTVEVVV